MIPDPAEVNFELSGGTLRVDGDLSADEEGRFLEALDRLFQTGAESMVVDLSGVQYLGSSYVRHVAMLIVKGTQKGRTVTVRAHERAARILKLGALDKIGTIEVVEDDD